MSREPLSADGRRARSRRDFLRIALAASGATLLAACAPPRPRRPAHPAHPSRPPRRPPLCRPPSHRRPLLIAGGRRFPGRQLPRQRLAPRPRPRRRRLLPRQPRLRRALPLRPASPVAPRSTAWACPATPPRWTRSSPPPRRTCRSRKRSTTTPPGTATIRRSAPPSILEPAEGSGRPGRRKTFIFHVRKGIKFHDGNDLTAEDIKWNWERAKDPEDRLQRRAGLGRLDLHGARPVHPQDHLREAVRPADRLDRRVRHAACSSRRRRTRPARDKWSTKPVGSGPFVWDSAPAGIEHHAQAQPGLLGHRSRRSTRSSSR